MKFAKPNSNRKIRTLLIVCSAFSMFSVGFSIWAAANDSVFSNLSLSPLIAGVTTQSSGTVSCISSLSLNAIKYAPGRGFVQADGTYGPNTELSGTFALNNTNAKQAISTFNSVDKQLSFKIELAVTDSNNNATSSSFTYGSTVSLTGFATNPPSKSFSNNAATFYVTLNDSEYSQTSVTDISFSISVSGPSSSFPTLSGATFSITITPGEFA